MHLVWQPPVISLVFSLAKPRTAESEYAAGKELGRGAFGTVFLTQNKQTQTLFAMKVINKKKLQLMSGSSSIMARLDQVWMATPFAVQYMSP